MAASRPSKPAKSQHQRSFGGLLGGVISLVTGQSSPAIASLIQARNTSGPWLRDLSFSFSSLAGP